MQGVKTEPKKLPIMTAQFWYCKHAYVISLKKNANLLNFILFLFNFHSENWLDRQAVSQEIGYCNN